MARFQKALLLYNPISGAHIERRLQQVAEVENLLRSAGGEVMVEATRRAGSAGKQAREAIEQHGCDAVFACGGDGTVFDTLQGVVGTGAMLGVIPLGTGNVLATDLGLPRNTLRATRRLLTYEPRRIAVGAIRCNYGAVTRYFTVCGGVGVHAELIYRSSAKAKQARGPYAYYTAGFHLLFKKGFVPFEMKYTDLSGETHRGQFLEMLAMRVSSFGGLLSRFHLGGSLASPYLQLAMLRKGSRWAMFRYMLSAMLGVVRTDTPAKDGDDPDVVYVRAQRATALPIDGEADRIRVQADGEMLGIMPAEITLVPDALNLLMPSTAE